MTGGKNPDPSVEGPRPRSEGTRDQDEQGTEESRPAGPVAGQVSPAHPPETPGPTPPAGEASAQSARGSDAGTGAPNPEQEVEADLDRLLAERDEYLDLAKRTKADFENYRKRMAAEVQAATLRGKTEVASGMIDAVDNLERALEAKGIDPGVDPLGDSEADQKYALEGFDHGVVLVLNGMRETLKRNGVEAFDPAGEKFDPNLHEALSTMPVDDAEQGTVVEVAQKGYHLDGQILRAARVVVSE